MGFYLDCYWFLLVFIGILLVFIGVLVGFIGFYCVFFLGGVYWDFIGFY